MTTEIYIIIAMAAALIWMGAWVWRLDNVNEELQKENTKYFMDEMMRERANLMPKPPEKPDPPLPGDRYVADKYATVPVPSGSEWSRLQPRLKYLDIDWVKSNLRVEVLSLSARKQREIDDRIAKACIVAEDLVLMQLNRTADDLKAEYGEVPQPVQAVTVMMASGLLEYYPPCPEVVESLLKPYKTPDNNGSNN